MANKYNILDTATGVGVDVIPANMHMTHDSTGGIIYRDNFDFAPGDYILSGSLTANTYKTVFSKTVPGNMQFCGVGAVDATVRDYGIRLTIDGVMLFDETSITLGIANKGFAIVGQYLNPGADKVAISLN